MTQGAEEPLDPAALLKEKKRLEGRVNQLQLEVQRQRKAQMELFQDLQKINEIQRLANEINSLSQERIYQVCVERIPLHLQAMAVSLYILDRETGELRLAAAQHPREIDTVVPLASSPGSVMELAVRRKQIVVVHDMGEFAERERIQTPHRAKYASNTCISAALVAGTEVVGVLNFADRLAGPFSETKDMPFISPLIQMIGVGIRNVQLHEQVQLQAKLDTMTGLYSHAVFFEEVEKEILRAERYKAALSLIMVDIDDFKHFNDNFGHQAGDVVIIDTANIIKGRIRKTDIAGRYGGDEFAVILPATDIRGAYTLATRIRNQIKEHAYVYEGQKLNVCISVGVCQWTPGMSLTQLVELGDEGLYKSKRAGKDQVQAVGEMAAQLKAG